MAIGYAAVIANSNPLPQSFVWQLQVKEMHPQGLDYSQGLYYFDYSDGNVFSSRQENNVIFEPWRITRGLTYHGTCFMHTMGP